MLYREPIRSWHRWSAAVYADMADERSAVCAPRRKACYIDTTTPICLTSVSAQPRTEGIEGLPMIGYFVISAVVIVATWTIFVGGGIVITYRDPKNAADIIKAIGTSFPIKGFWWRRR